MDNRYSFNIEWSEDDQEYIATCPAFPGLSAFGVTEEEALTEAKTALRGFIETCQAQGISLPESQVRETYSGQFRVRFPKSLHRIAAKFAEQENVSLNTFIIDAVRGRTSAEQFGHRVLNELRTAVASVLKVHPTSTQYTKTTERTNETVIVMRGSEGRRDQ